MATEAQPNAKARVHKRELVATVTSDKMNKTRVVVATRRVKDLAFKKYVNKRSKFKAHDENNETHVGDRVLMVESRPLSADKRWRIVKVLEKAKAS
jgi:small subunit ribosomal protein S17